MRKQLKSAGVAVQPNLFHLWNIGGNAQVDELKSGEAGSYDCASSSSSSGAPAGLGVSVETRSQSQPQSHDLLGKTEYHMFERIVTPGESTPNPSDDFSPGSLGKGKRRGQLVNDNSQSRHDSHTPDSTSGRPSEDQSRKNTRTLPVGKQRHATSSEGSQTRLFPLFVRSGQRRTAVSVAEAASQTDKGLDERRDQRADSSELSGKHPGSVLRAPSSVKTAGGAASTRPCSQSLPSSQITGNAIEGSVSRLPIHIEVTGSQEEPIVIDSSPVRDLREHYVPEPPLSPVRLCPSDRNEAFTSFFAKRIQGSVSNLPKVQKRLHRANNAKWPDRDEQHVRGPQRPFSCASLKFVRSHPRPCAGDPSSSLSDSVRYLRIGDVSCPHREPKYLVEPIGSQPDGHAKSENILQSSATCPAISRFLSADYNISGSSWNERWRPRQAAEVIGNEATSKYLRDWLRAQEIRAQDQDLRRENSGSTAGVSTMLSRTAKRPKVIRSVERARKRRRRAASDEESLGDWITEDDDDEEEETPSPTFGGPLDEDWPEQNECGSPWKPKLTRLSRRRPPDNSNMDSQRNDEILSPPTPSHDFSDRLTNTILLAGPSGSGKTAAVYACAEELGWEVFEVYPGIGKRNGASLLSLVGDVGKNHIVNRDSRSSANTYEKRGSSPSLARQMSAESKKTRRKLVPQAFASFCNPVPNVSANSTARRHSRPEQKSINVEERENSHTPETGHIQSSLDPSARHECASTSSEIQDSGRNSTRQSIILLEEVDILYAEDVNFWSTVVTLIRESRRPVIMTCNDSDLVPSADLPLQTTLTFRPCPLDLAVSYLQCLALVEGHSIAVEHIKSLYKGRHSFDVLAVSDDLTRPPVYPSSSPDLRHAINSLQFLCQGSPGFEDSSPPLVVDAESRTYDVQQGIGVLDDPVAWDWSQHNPSSPSPTPCGQIDQRKQVAQGIHKLWQTSDVLSMIDNDLSRNSLANLEIHSFSKSPPSDEELGYRYLEHEPNIQHLQDGIALYNHDVAMTTEAFICARRLVDCDGATAGAGRITTSRTEQGWKLAYIELLLGRSRHFACVSGVLDRISPGVSREGSAALILDYEPWVRSIDRSDMLLEAAVERDSESRTGGRGGRSTRNSQRTQYGRYFDLGDEERANWHSGSLAGGHERLRVMNI